MPSLRLITLTLAMVLGIYGMAHAPSAMDLRDADPLPDVALRLAIANSMGQDQVLDPVTDGSGIDHAADPETDRDDADNRP